MKVSGSRPCRAEGNHAASMRAKAKYDNWQQKESRNPKPSNL